MEDATRTRATKGHTQETTNHGLGRETKQWIEETERARQRDRGEKKEWEVCQSHIISSRPVNPYCVYHCYRSTQYTFVFYMCI